MLKKGFTIVELLIVIVVIGVLAALVIVNFSDAQKKSQIASVKSDLALIKRSMLAYKHEYGELPPTGDFCNHCGQTVPTVSWESTVLGALQTAKLLGSQKPAMDPWGNYYAYDDNDCNSNAGTSVVWSLGPDKTKNTADDITILVSGGCAQS